jgi:hypothetical protein
MALSRTLLLVFLAHASRLDLAPSLHAGWAGALSGRETETVELHM